MKPGERLRERGEMSTAQEVERLTAVYRHYRQDAGARQRWDGDNAGNQAILRERDSAMRRCLQEGPLWPLSGRRVLDVGCGSGQVLASLLAMGASAPLLHGVDLLPERIRAARRRFGALHFECANAEALPYADGHFDLVMAFTVFSSILDQRMATNVAREMRRVLKPGGAILWYDFRFDNPRNGHVRGMTRQKVASLFADFEVQLQLITLLPPVARRLGPLTEMVYPLLARVPSLRTHYIGLLHKRQ